MIRPLRKDGSQPGHFRYGGLLHLTLHYLDGHKQTLFILTRSDDIGGSQQTMDFDGSWYFIPTTHGRMLWRTPMKPYLQITARHVKGYGVGHMTAEMITGATNLVSKSRVTSFPKWGIPIFGHSPFIPHVHKRNQTYPDGSWRGRFVFAKHPA